MSRLTKADKDRLSQQAFELYSSLKDKTNPHYLTTSEYRNVTPELVLVILSGGKLTATEACNMANQWGLKGRSPGKTRPAQVADYSEGYVHMTPEKQRTGMGWRKKGAPKPPKPKAKKGKSPPKPKSKRKPPAPKGKKAAAKKPPKPKAKRPSQKAPPKPKGKKAAAKKAPPKPRKRKSAAKKPAPPPLPPKPKAPPLPAKA